MNKLASYWIWHYGDYEIYHSMKVNLRRQEYGVDYPAFWNIASPYVNVEFRREFTCTQPGYMIAYANGKGSIALDGVKYTPEKKIAIAPGTHTIVAEICKMDGLPALFVESDVCPSDASWTCNHRFNKHTPVGCETYFDSLEKNPEEFPFSYEHKLPVSAERREGGALYDFGTEVFGYLNIKNVRKEEIIGVFYGESVEEALAGEQAILFEYVNGQAEYRLRQRAFRYVFIVCSEPELPDVSMDYEYLPLAKKGDFSCDNELFNRIYETSVYTFHLNCREAFLDGIKRDRWVWSGDAYQSARINAYLFADPAIVRRTAIGLIGKEPIEKHINTILDYSFLWIIGLYEYYMTYGDVDFLTRIYPIAVKLIEFCETRCNEDGFIVGDEGDWTFIDWSEIDKTGAVCAEQMLFVAAYSALAAIAEVLGLDAEGFLTKGTALKKKVNEFYWKDELGAFIDSYESGKNSVTRHANIFAIMYDIATPQQVDAIVKNVLKNDNITKITTPYFEGYELDVLGKIGEFDAIEKMIHSYWGGMLSLGADTIWEEYVPGLQGAEHYAMYGKDFGKSLCHAWGAGPIYLFGRYYLGVYPTAPGYTAFIVEPHLGGLNEISGSVPVNGGTVKVVLNKERLCVTADKAGGNLIWKGKKYELIPNEELVIACAD